MPNADRAAYAPRQGGGQSRRPRARRIELAAALAVSPDYRGRGARGGGPSRGVVAGVGLALSQPQLAHLDPEPGGLSQGAVDRPAGPAMERRSHPRSMGPDDGHHGPGGQHDISGIPWSCTLHRGDIVDNNLLATKLRRARWRLSARRHGDRRIDLRPAVAGPRRFAALVR